MRCPNICSFRIKIGARDKLLGRKIRGQARDSLAPRKRSYVSSKLVSEIVPGSSIGKERNETCKLLYIVISSSISATTVYPNPESNCNPLFPPISRYGDNNLDENTYAAEIRAPAVFFEKQGCPS